MGLDDPIGASNRDGSIVRRRGVAEQQRPGDRVIEPIGPAGIRNVRAFVAGTQIVRIDHIDPEIQQRLDRHVDALGQARGAGREHHHHAVVAAAQDRLENRAHLVEPGVEIVVACPRGLALVGARVRSIGHAAMGVSRRAFETQGSTMSM
jgi:hypothetical protein